MQVSSQKGNFTVARERPFAEEKAVSKKQIVVVGGFAA